uniref:Uncharacterized protein n=1 Tax=Vespula pensylvanica TaxID=30213 RepID=A0A834U4L8_VESPE|nr:hypothetical protein H0235_012568 [Vespula pensylvanica]
MSEKSEFTFGEKITNASAITVTDILLTLSLSNRFRRFTVIQFNARQDVLWLAHFKREKRDDEDNYDNDDNDDDDDDDDDDDSNDNESAIPDPVERRWQNRKEEKELLLERV